MLAIEGIQTDLAANNEINTPADAGHFFNVLRNRLCDMHFNHSQITYPTNNQDFANLIDDSLKESGFKTIFE